MYSAVLATMLTVGGGAPAWGWHGCHGCHGCHSCHGCHGCHGCSGYAFGGGLSFGCSGCHCTGWGWGCSGCYCSGYNAFSGCSGCYCSGWMCSGCSCSGWTMCNGCSCSGWMCSGCYCSGVVGYATCAGCAGTIAAPTGTEKTIDKGKSPDKQAAARVAPSAATVTVQLPEDATLYIDDVKCPLTSGTRTFRTPSLALGQEYYYTLRAEVVRDGQIESQSQRVIVAAGRQVSAEFTTFTALQTAKR